jgi:small-conductance mechanosensitive channel/CRP-like cAMP-binding protein
MTWFQALAYEARLDFSLWLSVGLVLTALAVRAVAAPEGRRLRAATILVSLHLILMTLAATAHSISATSRFWRDLRLPALIIGAVAAVGMLSILVFGVLLPRLRIVAPHILRDVITGVLTVIAVLAVAARTGFDVSSVIATSAVLTAVIGLTLQDTLTNVVGGLSLQMDNSIKVGDWIKVGDVSGKVLEIRWRYTSVETRNWETVFLPNSLLIKGQVTVLGRRSGRAQQWRRWVWFNIDFRYAPSDVIAVVTKALKDARIENVAEDPQPNCILMELGDSYAKYAVRYWLTDLLRDDATDSEVRTRVYFALRRANIPLSMPAMAAFVTEETTARKSLKLQQEHDQRLKALKCIGLFNRLPEEVLEELAETLVAAPFAPGEVLTRFGAEAHWLYMIVHGEASVRVPDGPDSEREIGRITDGSFFGEMSLLTGEPRDATIVALTDVDCYRLDRSSAYELLTQRPEFAEHIAEVMAKRRVEQASRQEHFDRATQAQKVSEAKSDLLARIRRFFQLDLDDDEQNSATGT